MSCTTLPHPGKPALWAATLICAATTLLAQPPLPTDDPREKVPKPNYDAFLASSSRVASNKDLQANLGFASNSRMPIEPRLGVPTFLWTAQPRAPMAAGVSRNGRPAEESAARTHLSNSRKLYQLSTRDVESAVVASIHNTGRGAVIVKFRQSVNGIEVFREELNVIMSQTLELIGISGYLSPASAVPAFPLQPHDAIARATTDLLDTPFRPAEFMPAGEAGEYELYMTVPMQRQLSGYRLLDRARARRVIYHMPDRLIPGYYTEFTAQGPSGTRSLAYSYVISALDGRVLFRKNLTSDADRLARPLSYSYRVWAAESGLKAPYDGPQGTSASPHPTGLPDGFQPFFVPPSLVTLTSGPIRTGDPWLPPNETQTIGNNVEAYADLEFPDGFVSGGADIYGLTNAGRSFDRIYNTALNPAENGDQIQAAITQLFYTINFLHDWFYGVGFDEAAGNAQASNYGRRGLANDSIKAEAQDYEGFNNASMLTPADGGRPRMQMYIWKSPGSQALTVNSPPTIAGSYPVGIATFGPQSFNFTASVTLVNDGVAATSLTDGCESPFRNAAAIKGKIAVLDRGNCAFTTKVLNAQTNGAVGVVLVNNEAGLFEVGGTEPAVTIGTLSVSLDDGKRIKTQLANRAVNASLVRQTGIDRDGSIDNQIVAHEWAHYMSNRLIGNASGISTNMAQGLGEGWSDFVSLLMTVQARDGEAAANTSFNGAYAFASYATGGGNNGPLGSNSFYFGMRRLPYSTDFTKNPLTFQHISDAVPFPDSVPAHPIPDVPNSDVHNTGEVWATMLWECYAALLRDTLPPAKRLTFEEARGRMMDYLVASLKMTPSNPTLLEARDALLAAARASDFRDFALFWQAFARRGAGTGAVAPDRYSADHTPVEESYVAGGAIEFVSASLSDDQVSCDYDGMVDSGETGRLHITLRNSGAVRLNSTTATLSSSNPDVLFPTGNRIVFPPIRAFESSTAVGRIKLKTNAGLKQRLDLRILINDPALNPAGPVTAFFETYANAHISRGVATTDDVESPVSAWTPAVAAGPESWLRVAVDASPFNHTWNGPAVGIVSDSSLVSPSLSVGSTAFSFTFRHRFAFEATEEGNYDGGVIEISSNGGATWTDIGPLYTGTIIDETGNPLAKRSAYTGLSSRYPEFQTTTVNLGTRFARKRVQIRFRVGTDTTIGTPGWEIDDLSFSGLTNKPFHKLVADTGCR